MRTTCRISVRSFAEQTPANGCQQLIPLPAADRVTCCWHVLWKVDHCRNLFFMGLQCIPGSLQLVMGTTAIQEKYLHAILIPVLSHGSAVEALGQALLFAGALRNMAGGALPTEGISAQENGFSSEYVALGCGKFCPLRSQVCAHGPFLLRIHTGYAG